MRAITRRLTESLNFFTILSQPPRPYFNGPQARNALKAKSKLGVRLVCEREMLLETDFVLYRYK